MTLEIIEKAIRPQFVWVDHPAKYFQTSTNHKNEKFAGFGLMVFIGIANSFDIPKKDIVQFLSIQPPEYETKSKMFSEQWALILERKEEGNLCCFKDFTDRVYLKTKLTLNALNSHFKGETIHCALYI